MREGKNTGIMATLKKPPPESPGRGRVGDSLRRPSPRRRVEFGPRVVFDPWLRRGDRKRIEGGEQLPGPTGGRAGVGSRRSPVGAGGSLPRWARPACATGRIGRSRVITSGRRRRSSRDASLTTAGTSDCQSWGTSMPARRDEAEPGPARHERQAAKLGDGPPGPAQVQRLRHGSLLHCQASSQNPEGVGA